MTEDPFLIARSEHIDVLVDVTGSVEFGARVVLEAFAHGKPVVLMNAELDATIGPILQVYARKHGVILSACDGDEPGVQMNLVRWVKGLGLIPRLIGNVKGLQDPYRNPTTQKGWAEQWGQNPAMVTSFADGSKISFEQSIVANATGFVVRSRGMSQRRSGARVDHGHPSALGHRRAARAGRRGGLHGGSAGVKVFCLAEHPDPKQRHYLNLYKMGEGPLYPFWIPYHLVHFEVPNSIARVVLLGDELARPLGGPVVEVCAVAKRDLEQGETLDDYGMYMTYGEAVNADEMSANRYLPEGLVEGCRLRRAIPKDGVISYDDVELPAGSPRRSASPGAVPTLSQRDLARGVPFAAARPGGLTSAPWKSLRVPCVDAGGANTCVRTGFGPWETRGPAQFARVLSNRMSALRAVLLRTDHSRTGTSSQAADFPGGSFPRAGACPGWFNVRRVPRTISDITSMIRSARIVPPEKVIERWKYCRHAGRRPTANLNRSRAGAKLATTRVCYGRPVGALRHLLLRQTVQTHRIRHRASLMREETFEGGFVMPWHRRRTSTCVTLAGKRGSSTKRATARSQGETSVCAAGPSRARRIHISQSVVCGSSRR